MKERMANMFEEKITGVLCEFEGKTNKLKGRPHMDEYRVQVKMCESDKCDWSTLAVVLEEQNMIITLDLNSLLKFIEETKRNAL